MSKTRKIKAVFTIAEDNPNAGVIFKTGRNQTINFEDLTETERVKMLNVWVVMYKWFCRYL